MLESQRRDRIGSRCASPRIVIAQEHAPIVGDHVNDITHEIRPMASRNGQGNPAAYCILRQPTPTHLGKEMLQLARSVSVCTNPAQGRRPLRWREPRCGRARRPVRLDCRRSGEIFPDRPLSTRSTLDTPRESVSTNWT